MDANAEKIQREREIFEFVKSLTFNAMGIEDNFINAAMEDSINNKKNFNSKFEQYFYNQNKNIDSQNAEKEKLTAGLNFMKEVVKIHGTNKDNIKAAVVAVTDYFAESPEFTVKLMQNTLKSEEYKEEFDKKQVKEEEKIISLVRNYEI